MALTAYFRTRSPSTHGSSCPSSAASQLSRLTPMAAITPVVTCAGDNSRAAYAAPSRALLDEHTRIAWEVPCGYGIHTTSEPAVAAARDGHLDLGMLVSSHQKFVFWELIKISRSIHETHANITSVCTQQAGLDTSFRSRVASAYQELKSLTNISETSMAPHPDNLFVILSMFRPLADLFSFAKERFLPVLEELSLEDHTDSFAARFDRTMMVLSSTVRSTLEMVNVWIFTYASDEITRGGSVHEITRYLMMYNKLLFEHGALMNIILHVSRSAGEASQGVGRMDSTKGIMAVLISSLESTLEKRSECYQSAALQWLFLVNNMHFILQQQEVSETLGDDWVLKRRDKLESYISRYLDVSWAPVSSRLQIKVSMIPVCFKPSPLSGFYLKFEETYSSQKTWKVEDPLLRQHMREAVTEKVIPTYRSYLKKHPKMPPKFVKKTHEHLEELLSELFEG